MSQLATSFGQWWWERSLSWQERREWLVRGLSRNKRLEDGMLMIIPHDSYVHHAVCRVLPFAARRSAIPQIHRLPPCCVEADCPSLCFCAAPHCQVSQASGWMPAFEACDLCRRCECCAHGLLTELASRDLPSWCRLLLQQLSVVQLFISSIPLLRHYGITALLLKPYYAR